MVFDSRAKRLCRISCVESAVRLPVCTVVLDVEGRVGGVAGKEGEEKHRQTALPAVVSHGHCGCC